MAKNSQLGLYFILFLSRPRLVIPRLSATVSETGHWEWWSARCWSFDQGRAPASILPPPHLHDQYAIRAKYAAWAKYASIWPYTLETYHHTCMTGMRSAGLVSFCTNFITCLSFFAPSLSQVPPREREDNDGDGGARQWWLFAQEAIGCSLFSNHPLDLIFANWSYLPWVGGAQI